jgi:hypothetical protein
MSFARPSAPKFARFWVPAALVLLPLTLTGCGLFGSGEDPLPEAPKPCPSIAVLSGTDRVTRFNAGGTDLTDVELRAEFNKAALQCEYDVDDETGEGMIDVNLAFDGYAEIGAAATSRDATLDVFITVTRIDTGDTIVSKKLDNVQINFEPVSPQLSFYKEVEGLKLPVTDRVDGADYQILVGFQLSADQLAYNRKVKRIPIR